MFKLTKLLTSATNHELRTDEVIGVCTHYPKVGWSFYFASQPLNEDVRVEGGLRMITTSQVKEIFYRDGAIEFKTLNSTYRLEALDGSDLLEE